MSEVIITVREGVQAETVQLTIDSRVYSMDEIARLIIAGNMLASTVQAYFNKRGAKHAERAGNEDIFEMAEALANYGVER